MVSTSVAQCLNNQTNTETPLPLHPTFRLLQKGRFLPTMLTALLSLLSCRLEKVRGA